MIDIFLFTAKRKTALKIKHLSLRVKKRLGKIQQSPSAYIYFTGSHNRHSNPQPTSYLYLSLDLDPGGWPPSRLNKALVFRELDFWQCCKKT